MKVLIWNTEWANPQKPAGKFIREFAKSQNPEVICYTEVRKGLHPESGFLIESESDYGYKKTEKYSRKR